MTVWGIAPVGGAHGVEEGHGGRCTRGMGEGRGDRRGDRQGVAPVGGCVVIITVFFHLTVSGVPLTYTYTDFKLFVEIRGAE